jgi:hypothetical protein
MKHIALLGVAVFLILQLVPAPYTISTPPVDTSRSIAADQDVPEKVRAIVSRACADCHSNQTRVPWYGHVAPVSWMLAKDVTEARSAMNLSEWGAANPAVRLALASAACADVQKARMPKPQYLLMHPEARLAPDEVEAICDWPKAAMAAMIRMKREARAQEDAAGH